MLALESDGGAVHCGQSLQPLAGDQVAVILASPIRMKHKHAAPVGLLEFDQLAIGPDAKNPVQVEEVGFTGQIHTPLKIRPAESW